MVAVGAFGIQIATLRDVAVIANRAESLGFDSYWVPEHMAVPADLKSKHPRRFEDETYATGELPAAYWQVPDPFVALSVAAAVTTTIRLGTAICVVPQYRPLHLAKLAASLDFFSHGRLDLGVGVGWIREEAEAIGGVDWPHRWTQSDEALRAMFQVWSNPIGEFHGKYYDFPPIRMEPRPVQQPHPPIYLGGKPPKIIERLVEVADGWLAPRMTVDEVRTARRTLDDLTGASSSSGRRINITIFGLPDRGVDRDIARAFEDAGADRIVPWLRQSSTEAVIKELEETARILLD